MGMGGEEIIHERTRVQSAGWRGQGRSKARSVRCGVFDSTALIFGSRISTA